MQQAQRLTEQVPSFVAACSGLEGCSEALHMAAAPAAGFQGCRSQLWCGAAN